ncbi:ABC transporter ATP-binding protein [Neoroseomonas oryzicola]|uniref:ABC transporter ATP-binding protein n=1 Tax=Neoroseomonas oryzicola TaxID=535904 RepID=A0A9X9WF55_9PROT|nr:ABC transporter ATP-binding protein [Neoroseomonas oryzicola]MBR0658965.1 ABC transporter ATP-binding protein [Neoroseomonas oryzicola]NKE19699.1 ABC transporter ATP-binding protein [Neoroseomonas oryzicola]
MDDPLVRISGLRVAFDGVPVLRGVDLAVGAGEAVGVVGESGCGKSVTWLAALGLLPGKARVTGSVVLDGQELLGAPMPVLDRVRGGQIAMIFQDPASSLNPVHRIGRQVGEALRLHRGMDGAAARAETRRLLDQVGIPDAGNRMDAYPHELSGGQNQRVMIAMALAGRPRLLVADEPTTALDVTIQAQILDLLATLRAETGMALVLISHDLGVVAETCDRVAVMYAGLVIEEVSSARLFDAPAHPYTQGLLSALPPLDGLPRQHLAAIPGSVPEPRALPPGCAFGPRCPRHASLCDEQVPPLVDVAPGQRAACRILGADVPPAFGLAAA